MRGQLHPIYALLYALVFISDTELKTVPVGLNDLMFGDIFLWGHLMAASVLTTVRVVEAVDQRRDGEDPPAQHL